MDRAAARFANGNDGMVTGWLVVGLLAIVVIVTVWIANLFIEQNIPTSPRPSQSQVEAPDDYSGGP